MVALACGVAGSAGAQPQVPTFDSGGTFAVPEFSQAVAMTPPGEDLLGSSTVQQPDGFAEAAVGGLENGVVWILRNTTASTGAAIGMTFYDDVDVFGALGLPGGSLNPKLEDIKLASLTGSAPGEEDPDLLVAVSYEIDNNGEIERRGKVAVFRARRDIGPLVFNVVNEVDLDFPATGISTGDYSGDGIPDVLVATDYANQNYDPTPNPARVTVLQNNLRPGSLTGFGFLSDQGDLVAAQLADFPTHNVVSGEFRQLVSSGIGGGGAGNSLDFVAFGVEDGLTVGFGNGAGPYTFNINISDGAPCGGSGTWFGSGILVGDRPASLVRFDPHAGRDASIATALDQSNVSLIHFNTLNGALSHRCNGSTNLDLYNLTPNFSAGCSTPPSPVVSQTHGYVARGKLNSDTYDDLVHVNGFGQDLAMLLGRGSAPSNERIMLFDRCVANGHFLINYASGATSNLGTHWDRVLCADLNNDTYDDIVITRPGSVWGPSFETRIIVFTNTTGQ